MLLIIVYPSCNSSQEGETSDGWFRTESFTWPIQRRIPRSLRYEDSQSEYQSLAQCLFKPRQWKVRFCFSATEYFGGIATIVAQTRGGAAIHIIEAIFDRFTSTWTKSSDCAAFERHGQSSWLILQCCLLQKGCCNWYHLPIYHRRMKCEVLLILRVSTSHTIRTCGEPKHTAIVPMPSNGKRTGDDWLIQQIYWFAVSHLLCRYCGEDFMQAVMVCHTQVVCCFVWVSTQ